MKTKAQASRKGMREAQAAFASCECHKCKSHDVRVMPDCRRYVAFTDAFDRLVELDPALGWDIKSAYKQRIGGPS